MKYAHTPSDNKTGATAALRGGTGVVKVEPNTKSSSTAVRGASVDNEESVEDREKRLRELQDQVMHQ